MKKRRRSDPSAPLRGEVEVPGDKSISHRAFLLAALARGTSRFGHLNTGLDVRATAGLVGALGARTSFTEGETEAEVEGYGSQEFREPESVIDAGNSGTTVRCGLGLCAGVDGLSVLTGDATLQRRPMLRVVAPLRQMGASIDGRHYGDRLPLAVRGGELVGLDFESNVASAQVKTAVLLAGLSAAGATSVTEPAPSRDHTERLLRSAGVDVQQEGLRVTVQGGIAPEPLSLTVPGDFSSAAFLVAGALLLPGSDLTITAVGLNPTRAGLLRVLDRMGANVERESDDGGDREPVGDLRIRSSSLRAAEVGPDEVPSLIDELPVFAVLATQAEGISVVRGAEELRVKESDRIETMATALRALGADIEPTTDGFVVTGPTPLNGGEVDSAADHRVALSLAVAGLVAKDNVRIKGWSSTETSFPEFLPLLAAARSRS
ncbi:MAG: 3-phosphoshikimate 1-carboxyvinyltransferase [Actinomycetota bacterium]|nr:3-phosphoshikimate 1-carboxyvinyltransferase [Actinomycetota bacterium]